MSEIKSVIKVAATYIGTVIGAGFASGQEVLRFFTLFGLRGIWGLVFCTVMFAFLGMLLLFLGHRLKAASYHEIIIFACGKKFGPAIDLVLSFFLFGALSVMLAGAGAVFTEQLGWPAFAGTFVTLILSVITVFFGLSGIIRANLIVVPVMISLGLAVSLPEVHLTRVTAVLNSFSPVSQAAAPHWLLSAGLYMAFNLVLAVPVLAPLGREISSRRILLSGGLLGGTLLGALALTINLALLSTYPASAGYQVPMLMVAGKSSPVLLYLYIIILWAEIFTTIIGNLFGLATRLTELTGSSYKKTVLPLMLGALILSRFGFARLVTYLYPMFGYIAIVFVFCLVRSSWLKTR